MNKINKKYHSIKLDFKFSNEKNQFLDTLVYKDHNNHLQTTLYKKPFERHAKCKIYTSSFTKKRAFLTVKH